MERSQRGGRVRAGEECEKGRGVGEGEQRGVKVREELNRERNGIRERSERGRGVKEGKEYEREGVREGRSERGKE